MSRLLTAATGMIALVALLAACSPGEPEFTEADRVRAGDRPVEEDPDAPDDGEPGVVVAVTGIDIDFVEDELQVPAGAVTIELTNEGRIFHDFTIEELGDRVIVDADPGETNTGNVTLEAGSYTYYCSVPGHRSAGMEGTLTAS